MREWVVKLLGGFSASDMEREQLILEVKADEVVQQNEKLWLQLQEKDNEIARLTNLMLTRAGFLSETNQNNATQPKHEPINKRPSWKQIQRELEREDARKLADQTERRWRDKSGAMPTGEGDNESLPSGNSIAS